MRKAWGRPALFAAMLVAAASLAIAPMQPARAQEAGVPAAVGQSLLEAAGSGPRALLQRLDEVLAANPGLAATPDSAAALTRAATLPIRQFRGANVPVYREVASRIIAAAPPALRAAVSRAVAESVRQVASTDPMVREPLAGDVEALTRQARREAAQAARTRGIPLGDFLIYPEAQVSEFYDNNIFATKTGEQNDFVTVIAPQVFVASNWARHSLNFQAHGDVTLYNEHTKENSTDYWFSSEGQYDFSDTTNAFGGTLFGQWHEDRESPDDVNGLEPTIYRELRGFGGLSHRIDATTVRVGGTWQRLTFDDTPAAGGTIFNGDRDRDHVTAGARFIHRLNETFSPYFDANFDGRNYRLARDFAGFDRDSQGYRLFVGTNVSIASVLAGEIYAGYMGQDYDDPTLKDVAVPGFGGNVRWAITDNVLISAWADRSIQETTLFAASSYVYTATGATIDYDITKAIVLTLRGSLAHSAFEGNGRVDNDYDTGFGARYNFTDNLYVAADYRFQRRISNAIFSDYSRHQVFLRAGANF